MAKLCFASYSNSVLILFLKHQIDFHVEDWTEIRSLSPAPFIHSFFQNAMRSWVLIICQNKPVGMTVE